MEKAELELLKKKALEQFKTGKSLFGEGGAFAPMLKEFLEEALEAEMEEHLSKERDQGNKRNGKGSKTVKSSSGELEIQTPQDRHSSFDPEIVKKRQRILADNLEDKIIGLYGLGTSLRDISAHIQEMYDTEISTSVLSEITDRIIPKVKAWQSRPLEAVFYFIAVRMDTREKLKIMVTHVLKQAKRVFGIPDFKYYALSDGMSALFKRAPGNLKTRQHHANGPPDQLLLDLF